MDAKVEGPYGARVRDHFSPPRIAGTIPNPSGKGLAKSPVDSDTVLITLRIANNQIEDATFKVWDARSRSRRLAETKTGAS